MHTHAMVMTRDDITERVAAILEEALGKSRTPITPATSLVGDLAMESIDFLDLIFRLEKEFGIEVARGELFPQEMLRDAAMVTNGQLTAAGVAAIRERFAFADLVELRADEPVQDLMNDLLTVNLIVDYVESKIRRTAEVPAG